MTKSNKHNRRNFLQRAGAFGVLASTPLALDLGAIGSAAAQTSGDYRALVCVFLNGGNDQSNTIVPVSDAEYAKYQTARPTLALAKSSLLPISPTGFSGPRLGLHPALASIKPLIDQGRCGILANVGMLSQPTSKAQWNGGIPAVQVPIALESHSDQANQWQTGVPNAASTTGWLGRTADLLKGSFNSGQLSMCISTAGNNQLQAGSSTIPYAVTTAGAVPVAALAANSGFPAAALRKLMTEQRSHLLEQQMNQTAVRSLDAERIVTAALAGVNVATAFPATGLGAQLKMVARMIAARTALGQRRQVFYVSLGGFDFHSDLLSAQNNLLKTVSDGLAAFYQATVELGVANNVTTFTASEFGRALQPNGDGSDHGWGGHHFVLGGQVRGNRVFGTWPTVALGAPEDARRGILIPTTSVDEYATTLATWLGVAAADLPKIMPNIGRFARPNLGFFS